MGYVVAILVWLVVLYFVSNLLQASVRKEEVIYEELVNRLREDG